VLRLRLYLWQTADNELTLSRCKQHMRQSEQFLGRLRQGFGLIEFSAWRMLGAMPCSLRVMGYPEGEMRRFKLKTPHLKFKTCHPKLQMKRLKFRMTRCDYSILL